MTSVLDGRRGGATRARRRVPAVVCVRFSPTSARLPSAAAGMATTCGAPAGPAGTVLAATVVEAARRPSAPLRSPCLGCGWTTGRGTPRSRRTAPRCRRRRVEAIMVPHPEGAERLLSAVRPELSAVAPDWRASSRPGPSLRRRRRLAPLPAAQRDGYVEWGSPRCGPALADAGIEWAGVDESFIVPAAGMAVGRPMLRHLGRAGPPAGARGERLGVRSAAFRLGCVNVAAGLSDVALVLGGGQPARVYGRRRGYRGCRGRDRAVHPLQPAPEEYREPLRRPAGTSPWGGGRTRQRGAQPPRARQRARTARGVLGASGCRLADLAAVLPGRRRRGGVRWRPSWHPAAGDRPAKGGAGGLLGGVTETAPVDQRHRDVIGGR